MVMTLRGFVVALVAAFLIPGATSAAKVPTGDWRCHSSEAGTHFLKFVGGKVIHTDGNGKRRIPRNPVVSSNLVLWIYEDTGVEYEFYPAKKRLIHKGSRHFNFRLEYKCKKLK